jgi:hypothetical protein
VIAMSSFNFLIFFIDTSLRKFEDMFYLVKDNALIHINVNTLLERNS